MENNFDKRLEDIHLSIVARLIHSYVLTGLPDGTEVLPVNGGFALSNAFEARIALGPTGDSGHKSILNNFDNLEQYCVSKSPLISVEISSLTDPTLVDLLVARGYQTARPSDVLVCSPVTIEKYLQPTEFRVRGLESHELVAWSRAVASGLEVQELEPSAHLLAISASSPSVVALVTELRDQIVGGGLFACLDRVGWLLALSTIPSMRRRGAQLALLRRGLEYAYKSDCDVVAAEAELGSSSHRNLERLGFHVVYQRFELVKALRS